MGMFDDIRCKYPLPVEGANDKDFQTKSLVCWLNRYEIREDGTLWRQNYDPCDGYEAEIQRDTHTGEVFFYTGTSNGGWLEFGAFFVDGKVMHLRTLSDGSEPRFKPQATEPQPKRDSME